MIYIISSPPGSDKTSALFQWLAKNPDADGVLQPVVDETRFYYLISTKSLVMTGSMGNNLPDNEPVFNENCKRAADHLTACLAAGRNTVIIDGYGLAESTVGGLRNAVDSLIGEFRHSRERSLLVVVNSEAVEVFISDYQFKEGEYMFARIIDSILK